jgi:hypothetical protein
LSISFPDGGPARLQQVLLDQSSIQSDLKAAERIADMSGSVSEQFIYGKPNASFYLKHSVNFISPTNC